MPKTVPDSGALPAYQREGYIRILLAHLKARTAQETGATPSVTIDWTGTVLLPPSGKSFDMPHLHVKCFLTSCLVTLAWLPSRTSLGFAMTTHASRVT